MLPLSFRTKTNTVFAVALLGLVTIGFLSFRETARLVDGERWVSHTRQVLETSASMSSHLSEAIAARRGYLLFGSPNQPELFTEASRATQADLV